MKTYRVTGPRKVYGHSKGETFDHEYTPEQEAAQIRSGFIEIVVQEGDRPKRQQTLKQVTPTRPSGAETPRRRPRR